MLNIASEGSVRQLRQAGARPSDTLIRQILKDGDNAFQPLLDLALDHELFNEDEPQTFAPIHALRLLAERPKAAMITPLLAAYPVEIHDELHEMPRLWASETPQMIGKLGAAAIDPLWDIIDSADWNSEAKMIATIAHANAVTFDPSQREPVIAGLFARLRSEGDANARTNAAAGLATLGVAEAYSEVMTLYRAGKLDKAQLSAASARQLLLTGGEKALNCIHHTLQERYDQHGPRA